MKKFETTKDIKIPSTLIDQVIGQEKAVRIVKKAAQQHRNILLIGDPGTGKTMLAQAMAELMPITDLEDVLVYKNPNDENKPLVKTVKTYPETEAKRTESGKPLGDGQGRQIIQRERLKNRIDMTQSKSNIVPITTVLVILLAMAAMSGLLQGYQLVVIAAIILGIFAFSSALMFVSGFKRVGMMPGIFESSEPKLIVDNTGMIHAPFMEATGSRAGALFGDVKHDPLQCIPVGETVLLDSGKPVRIEKLVEPYFGEGKMGELKVESGTGPRIMGGFDSEFRLKPAEVRRVYKNRYIGKLVNIKTRGGSNIRVTPNHPIACFDSQGTIVYVEAGKIDAAQRIAVPERLNGLRKRTLDTALLFFIADLIADGYIGERHVEFNLKREFKIETIKKDVERLGYVPKIKIRPDGATCIAVNSASLCKELREMGIKEGKEKRIPQRIFELDTHSVEQFLSRLLSLDGYINKQGQFELLSSSRMLIREVRALLLTLDTKARYKTRLDRGYGKEKGTIQHMLRWNNFNMAKTYYVNTINPIHRKNMSGYIEATSFSKESFDDVVPLNFAVLDKIRTGLGVSKESVHHDFWSVNPDIRNYTNLTRNLLRKINGRFSALGAIGEDIERLKLLSEGDYAFDEVVSVEAEDYDGLVYNLTTESGNYLVDFVLTHNSGGLGTPAHLRVESGAVHRANKGVLFIDEVADLEPKSQQELLTAMQEKKFVITGQSELSSGAIVRTEPVPCDFLLVAAGNLPDMGRMHPALRSRIRGYGYEVYMESTMPDNEENREKIMHFIAQEVNKDKRIPPFGYDACMEIINEARRRAGRKHRLTLILRDLGGLIRAAGDLAVEKGSKYVTPEEVIGALTLAKPIEAQYAEQELAYTKDYQVFGTRGFAIGKVNGLAVIGNNVTATGIVTPIVAEVTPASSRAEGKLIATGKLGTIAREAVKNISAVIKRHMHMDIASYDIHVQFIQTYSGVEGDSASVSVAVSVISALEGIPVRQDVAMTGSLSVRGMVLPVGGVNAKVRAAIEAGIKYVIIPYSNREDLYLGKKDAKKIKLFYVKNIADVLTYALKQSTRRDAIIKELKRYLTSDYREKAPLLVENGTATETTK